MSRRITDLRDSLFETMELLKTGKIDVATAKAMSDIGQTIINSAKTEIDYIKAVGGDGSGFIPLSVQTNKTIERPKAQYSNKTREDILNEHA